MGHRDTLSEIARSRLPAAWEPPSASPQPERGRPADLADAAPLASLQPARPRPVLRRYGWWLGLAVLVAAAAGRSIVSADAPVAPLTATAEVGTIEDNVSATGTVQPLEFVDVGTQVTGQLRALHVAIGSIVKKGQLLAEIDPSVFESKVATGQAALRSLEAQLRDREAQSQLADLVRERNRQLKKADAVSEEALQQSEAAAVQARAQVDAIRAQIQQARSALSGDEANLRYTRIHAPMAGTVVALNAKEGQTLVSSQQAPVILRIADLGTMTVWAQVSEADVPRITVGMPVSFNTLGLPDRRWNGRVRQVLPTPETVNNVVLYNVLFDVTNSDAALKPQMSTQVFFRVAGAENAVTIPSAALQSAAKPAKAAKPGTSKDTSGDPARRHDKAYIVRVLRDGRIEERAITVGLHTRMQAQVTSGLQAGEEVVVGPAPGSTGKAGKHKTSGAAAS